MVGRAGSWPVPTLDAVAAQGLADGFCTEWPHPDGGVEAYAVFPARFDGERYESPDRRRTSANTWPATCWPAGPMSGGNAR